jgi:hypothetical protein
MIHRPFSKSKLSSSPLNKSILLGTFDHNQYNGHKLLTKEDISKIIDNLNKFYDSSVDSFTSDIDNNVYHITNINTNDENNADVNFIFSYNKKTIFDTFSSIMYDDVNNIYNEMLKYNISLGEDAAIFLNAIMLNLYGRLSNAMSHNHLRNKILQYSENFIDVLLPSLDENKHLEYNIDIIMVFMVKTIMNLCISSTIHSLQEIITYRNLNILIVSDYDLNEVFKWDVIPLEYFIYNIDYNIYYEYPLLIPSEFDKFLQFKKVMLDNDKRDFLLYITYITYTKNNYNYSIEYHLTKLLKLINHTMSFKEFSSILFDFR